MAGTRFIPSHLLLLNRKGQALPQAQPFLHSFRGCVVWAETFSLFTNVSSPHTGNALSAAYFIRC